MNAQAYESRWHGQPAITLENDWLRVTCVPSVGAKIVELFDKRAAYEWLVGPTNSPFGPIPYGSVYTQQDMSGWDEMFPTVDADFYPVAGMFAGLALPDHGEVWTLPWAVVECADARLTLSVRGYVLPLRLERALSFAAGDTLRLDYQVTNDGQETMAYLWTAHPQFVSRPEMRVHLDDAVDEVVNAYPRPLWGNPGSRLTWPIAQAADGNRYALDRQIPGETPACHKVYAAPERAVRSASLVIESGLKLSLRWTPPVDYLGILVDTRMFNPSPIIALEPSTSFYDSLSRAYSLGLTPRLAPGEQHTWSLLLNFAWTAGEPSYDSFRAS